jgi:hypothetical protein
MRSPVPSDDPFESDSYEPWDPYNDLSQPQTQADRLLFCKFDDWDSDRVYDEDQPRYIHYSIEWKVTVNNRAIMPKDTEQNIVLSPADYYEHFLKPKLDNFLRRKNRPLRSEDTNVTVSVTARSERNLTKRYDDTSIEWTEIENRFLAWGELFRAGKRLLLNLSFNYIDTSQSTTTSLQRAERRVYPSTTQQMLAERAAQLDAEQVSSGQLSTWAHVYKLFRCPGPPCNLGPYCWCDPIGKKHYKLLTCHLKSLIKYMDEGNTLQSHDDVPEDIREQLFREQQQSLERHKKSASTSTASLPPINIHVLPAQSSQTQAEALAPDVPLASVPIKPLHIPGLRDEAVEEYCAWQQSQVKKSSLKVEYQKACDVIIEEGLDLELIRRDPKPQFLIERGIKRGIAEHVVGDIDYWAKRYKRAGIGEELE